MRDIEICCSARSGSAAFVTKRCGTPGPLAAAPFAECSHCGTAGYPSGLGQKPICLPQLRRASAHRRVLPASTILDHGSFGSWRPISAQDPLAFPGMRAS